MAGKDYSSADDLANLAEALGAKLKLDEGDKEGQESKYKEELILKTKTILKTYEFHQNWILDHESFQKDAKTVYTVITNKMIELGQESDEAEIKNNALELVAKKMTQIFLGIYLNKFDKVDKLLKECEEFIRRCSEERKYIPIEYSPGFFHCLLGLEAFFISEHSHSESSLATIESICAKLEAQEVLSNLGQVGLFAMKAGFLGDIYRKRYEAQNEVLQKMVSLDPGFAAWHLWLHNIKRFERRDVWNSGPPRDEEMAYILKAAELAPANPLVLIGVCDALADIVRDQGPRWTGYKDFGVGRQFHSSEEMVEYLRKQTRRILVLDPMSVKVNISVAQIFSSVLPKPFRDYPFAKLCIERALLFHPNSSKANARMGIYCLTVENDPKEAEKHFENSVLADNRNFPALVELIQTYMANHSDNSQKIDDLLEKELNNPYWDEGNRGQSGQLYFAKGIYSFLKGKPDDGISNWITAVEKGCKVEDLKKLGYFRSRYCWDEEALRLDAVMSHVNTAIANRMLSVEKSVILKAIQRGLSEEFEYQRSGGRGFRGGRPGRGPRGGGGPRGRSSGRGGGFFNHGGFGDGPFGHGGGRKGAHDDYSYGGGNRSNYEKPKVAEVVDHYKILGVASGTSKSEIKKAYVKLCLQVHPDKNPNLIGKQREENLERMKEINVAYEVLCK